MVTTIKTIIDMIKRIYRFIRSRLAKNVLVCYGTSLTAGSGWVKMLQMKLPDWYVINSGKGGMNSEWGLDNYKKLVLRYKPKIVLMEFAINDAYKHATYYRPVSLHSSIRNIHWMIKEFQEEGIKVYLMVLNPPLNMYLSGRNPKEDRPYYYDYYKQHKQLAEKLKIDFIDVCSEWLELTTDEFLHYCPDGLHPNALGSRAITVPKILEALCLK